MAVAGLSVPKSTHLVCKHLEELQRHTGTTAQAGIAHTYLLPFPLQAGNSTQCNISIKQGGNSFQEGFLYKTVCCTSAMIYHYFAILITTV